MSASEEDDLSPVEDDLEVIEEPENTEPTEQNNETEEANQNEEGEAEDKKEVKVKRVRNPQPKLDVERLKGPRGLQMLENVFKNVTFRSCGHEEEDLNILMKSYEYWCHRLFPKFPFDDCLERMEKLGTKKPLQTYLKKIRMNMLDDEGPQQQHEDDEIVNTDTDDEVPQSSSFDNLLPAQTRTQPQSTNPGPVGLSQEQLERIRINRERAQRLRQQMLIKNRANIGSSSQSNSQNSQINTDNDIVAVSSQNSSICNALKDISFTENMSVDSEPFTNQPIAEDLSELQVVGSETVGSQEKMSVVETSPNLASDDEAAASQNSIEGESFCFETVAVVHTENPSQESSVASAANSQTSVEDAIAQTITNQVPIENMSVDYASQEFNKTTPLMSKTASQRLIECTSEAATSLDPLGPQKTVESQDEGFETTGFGRKSENQTQAKNDLIMEVDTAKLS